jgi:DNA-binding XRE family transcriptional regulator
MLMTGTLAVLDDGYRYRVVSHRRSRHHSCLLAPPSGLGRPPVTQRQYPILGYSRRGRSACLVEKSIYSEEYQRLCDVLKSLRRKAGLTQVQVAAELDVPQSFVSKYESGERRLDVCQARSAPEG